MICRMLRRIERFLREHQDPRYRNLPWILPDAWHGSGGPLTKEQLAQFNVKNMGFDATVVSQQPINRMMLAIAKGAQKHTGAKHDD